MRKFLILSAILSGSVLLHVGVVRVVAGLLETPAAPVEVTFVTPQS